MSEAGIYFNWFLVMQGGPQGGESSCIEDKSQMKLIVEKPEVSLSMHTWFKSFAAALACQNFPQL